ncbi:ABC transporter permease [Brachybacterium sp. DNPG3]
MTTASPTSVPARAASAVAAPSRPALAGAPTVSQLRRTVRFSADSTLLTLRNGLFLFFTIALPVIMFLMFNSLFGGFEQGTTTVGTVMMVRMAAYGGLGAAINAGAMVQLERANGWLRQLMVAGLSPRSFVIGKMVAAMAVALPALIGVYIAGLTIGDVHLSVGEIVSSLLVLWASMLPLAVLGLALGLALKPSAVGAAATIGMMLLAVAGGLWFPYEMFPEWMQTLSRYTPTFWMGDLGTWAITGEGLPVRGVITLAAWTAVLGVASALLMGRATRASSRR